MKLYVSFLLLLTCIVVTKGFFCPPVPTGVLCFAAGTIQCRSSFDCIYKRLGLCCCPEICGGTVCLPRTKPGNCPVTLTTIMIACPIQINATTSGSCTTDWDCPGFLKCCSSICGGPICTPPSISTSKPGACPATTGIGSCAIMCKVDSDCGGAQKCCPTACGGALCNDPILLLG